MLDYKKEIKKRIDKNKKEILLELDSNDMTEKIKNWANKFNYSFNTIKEKIRKDEIFRCIFIKDPLKQNICQTLAGEYIKSLNCVKNFKTLSAGGKNALYVENGRILTGDILNRQHKETKSIDFYWETGEYKFYATHKYTCSSGGAQDNQYIDIQNFLKNVRDSNINNTFFLAICDGDYYLEKDSQTNDKTKIDRLNRLTDNKISFALNINDLKNFLEKFIDK